MKTITITEYQAQLIIDAITFTIDEQVYLTEEGKYGELFQEIIKQLQEQKDK